MDVPTLKKQKAISIALAFGVIHATICLFLIPWANAAFQVWFDTGSPQSAAERFGYLASLVLSFPIAFWSLWLHPARISAQAFVASVVLNSLFWSSCLYLIMVRFSRRTASDKASQLTAR
jgi:hypothetical protein